MESGLFVFVNVINRLPKYTNSRRCYIACRYLLETAYSGPVTVSHNQIMKAIKMTVTIKGIIEFPFPAAT